MLSVNKSVFGQRKVQITKGFVQTAQEETTYLGIPCLTLRPNTERPITITLGTNRLCTLRDIERQIGSILAQTTAQKTVPDLWDGQTAVRISKSIQQFLTKV